MQAYIAVRQRRIRAAGNGSPGAAPNGFSNHR
jgi:hypothetical protein